MSNGKDKSKKNFEISHVFFSLIAFTRHTASRTVLRRSAHGNAPASRLAAHIAKLIAAMPHSHPECFEHNFEY